MQCYNRGHEGGYRSKPANRQSAPRLSEDLRCDRQAAGYRARSRRSDQRLGEAPRRRSRGGLASALGRSSSSDARERQPNRGPVSPAAGHSARESERPCVSPIQPARQAGRCQGACKNRRQPHFRSSCVVLGQHCRKARRGGEDSDADPSIGYPIISRRSRRGARKRWTTATRSWVEVRRRTSRNSTPTDE